MSTTCHYNIFAVLSYYSFRSEALSIFRLPGNISFLSLPTSWENLGSLVSHSYCKTIIIVCIFYYHNCMLCFSVAVQTSSSISIIHSDVLPILSDCFKSEDKHLHKRKGKFVMKKAVKTYLEINLPLLLVNLTLSKRPRFNIDPLGNPHTPRIFPYFNKWIHITKENSLCPSLVSIAVINTMSKSNLWKEGFISFHKLQSLIKEN